MFKTYIEGKFRTYEIIIGSVLVELSDTPVKGYTREFKDDTGIPSFARYIRADIEDIVKYYKKMNGEVIKENIVDEYDVYTEIKLMSEDLKK